MIVFFGEYLGYVLFGIVMAMARYRTMIKIFIIKQFIIILEMKYIYLVDNKCWNIVKKKG